MKANKLMIGDYVRQKHSGIVLMVSEIVPPYIRCKGEEGQFHEDTIEPILLTPEIMKKSGFKPNKECDYIYTDSDPDVVIDMFEPNNPKYRKPLEEYLKEVGISLLQSNYLFGPLDAAIIIKAYYVHELQHFIKPCGIEREIVL
jgi:hypothetical protein